MDKIEKKTINSRNYILFFSVFSLIVFFEPGFIKEKNFLEYDTIFDILKLIFSLFIIVYYCFYKFKEKNYSRSKIIYAVCLYQVFCFLVTIIKKGDIVRFSGPAITSVVVLMLTEILVNKNLFFTCLKKLNIYFRICYLINFITIIINFFIQATDRIYFLGIDNRFIFMFFFWMLSEALCDINEHKKITRNSIIVFAVIEFSLLIVNTVAAMIVFLLWIIPLFYPKIKPMKQSCKIYNYIFLLEIFIVRFKLSYLFNKLLNIIGKYAHMSGRVLIWDVIFDRVLPNNYLLGIGMQSAAYDINFFSNNVSSVYAVNHAHNTFVDIFYRYGFLGFLIFSFILYITIKKLNNCKDSQYATVLFISLIISLVLGIFDTFLFVGFYLLIGIIFNMDIISTCNNKSFD